jgi:hypothetical protein
MEWVSVFHVSPRRSTIHVPSFGSMTLRGFGLRRFRTLWNTTSQKPQSMILRNSRSGDTYPTQIDNSQMLQLFELLTGLKTYFLNSTPNKYCNNIRLAYGWQQ